MNWHTNCIVVAMKKEKPNQNFNPDDFFENPTVEDVVKKFPILSVYDFTHISLKEKLIELNHEVVSSDYEDKKYASIESYYKIEVDPIV